MDIEILKGFQEETNKLLKELGPIIEVLDESDGANFPTEPLKEFAQKIDRIMGAAKTLAGLDDPEHQGLKRIGLITELCKTLGYKAAELQKSELIPLFAAFWADTLEVVEDLTNVVEDSAKTAAISSQFSLVLQKRLRWLADKVAAIEQKGPTENLNQLDVDALLKDLGM